MATATQPTGRGHAARPSIWFGFLGGAAAWSVQEIVSYVVVAHTCYPSFDPLPLPDLRSAWVAALVISLVLLGVAIAALVVAVRLTTRTMPESHGYAEASAESHRETANRYLAFGGVLFSSIFVALIVYNCLTFATGHTCW